MNAIKGKYRKGQIVLEHAADWPDDTDVLVEPMTASLNLGMREEDWVDTPEAIARWLEWYDSLEPIMTPEEEAVWRAALQEQKEYDKSKSEERTQKLIRMFE
jgi:hypothetical protein